MSLAVRAGKAMDRVYLRLRDRRAFGVTSGERAGFAGLRGHSYALLVTFRRSGTPVPTPVWFGLDGGRAYVFSFADAGKVKRLRNDPRALLAPCTVRGKPLGEALEGRARILPPDEWDRAERAIAANYGVGRRLYNAPWRGEKKQAMTYLEIEPAVAAAG